jgi:quinoprotein glucose dehydrogenase
MLQEHNVLSTTVLAMAATVAFATALHPESTVGNEPQIAGGGARRKPFEPAIASASDQAQRALRSFRVPRGLAVELFAAEPLLANPVAFCVDPKGVAYVAETFRLNEGVTDTREHMDWLEADLACRTVADRVIMYQKYLGKKFETFRVEHERVRARPTDRGPRR